MRENGGVQGYRDDGVVLRTQKLGEADRIITLLTRQNGRVRAVAKGVRRTKSRFGARLEPFTHVDVLIHPGRSLDVITQAEVIRPYGAPLAEDYPRYTAGTAMLETAERFTPMEKEPALRQFLLLIGGLRALGEMGEDAREPRLILDAFLLRSLAVAGYAPALEACARGGRNGLRRLPAARRGGAERADRRAHARAAAGRVGRRHAERAQAPGRVQWPGGRVPAVAPGALDTVAASRGARLSKTQGEAKPVTPRPPDPHPSGARPPGIPRELVPRHVALVMDGDGRWAKQRGLPRTEGHKEGESSLLDVIMGAIELGIPYLSAYAFSTENWRRHPDEVRFLMGFNRDVIHRRRDLLNEMGVRIRWAGRRPRLWRSVIRELEYAEQLSAGNTVLTLQFCVNYGGRAEIADAAAAIAAEVAAGKIRPDKIDERLFSRYLDEPDIPEVDLFVRSSGEQRLSNFLLWQSAYAELVFLDTLWPDFDRRHLWHACEIFASRDRRYGGAVPNAVGDPAAPGAG
jgi:trans,polycis-polyprenyl diphosphate synthase